ncbi:MAG: PLP-dependent aminotransferase family protein [Planctomycetia bacterium]|nr:PLP-dependent aminotransferase family protein [Planctomycetia bacterium]
MSRKPLLSITLNPTLGRSLQDQLFFGLKQQIQSGLIVTGTSLPSSRDLARDLGVSRNTVIAAYDRLSGEGYLETRPRSGIYVTPAIVEGYATRPNASDRHNRLHFKASQTILHDPIPFRPCQPDVRLFPLTLWNRLRLRALRKFSTGILHYQSAHALGLPILRQALALYLHESRGVNCNWEQIAITTGSQQAIYLLSQILLKPGDHVLLENPGYPGAREAFHKARALIRPLSVDAHGALPPKKIEAAKLIYTTPSRQFPTGACQPVARRMALLEFTRKAKAWLLEDDYDSEFRYTRPPMPSLHSLDVAGRVIYLGTMSKVLFPSLRIGYAVLPPALIHPFETLRLIMEDHGPLIDQATLAEFVYSGAFYTHIRRCRKNYAAKLATFLNAARKHQLPLDFPHIDGGMNLMGFFREADVNTEAISERLRQQSIMVPSSDFYSIKKTKPGLVFGFTAFDHNVIREGIESVARVIAR